MSAASMALLPPRRAGRVAVVTTCRSCGAKTESPQAMRGRIVLCPKCERPFRVRGAPTYLPAGVVHPSPLGCRPEDESAEHLRVIRLYLGWLLVCVAVPLGLSLASAAALLILRAV